MSTEFKRQKLIGKRGKVDEMNSLRLHSIQKNCVNEARPTR